MVTNSSLDYHSYIDWLPPFPTATDMAQQGLPQMKRNACKWTSCSKAVSAVLKTTQEVFGLWSKGNLGSLF